MRLIMGNALSLISCMIMVSAGFIKSRKKTLRWQIIQVIINAAARFILGATGGAVINCFSAVRNVLAYKEMLTLKIKVVLCTGSVGMSLYFNSSGLLGILPVISTIAYISFLDKFDGEKFKYLNMFTSAMWGIYDFGVHNYVSGAFNAGCFISSGVAAVRIVKDKKKTKV